MVVLTQEQIAEFEALYEELFPAAQNAQLEGMISVGHNWEPVWGNKRDELVTDIVAKLWLILHPEEAEEK